MDVRNKPMVTLKGSSIVVPSEPTPRVMLYLSNLDTMPAIVEQMVQTVYLFKKDTVTRNAGNSDSVSLLKSSLSKALVPYFPMSGRLSLSTEGRLELNCNEGGALFVEAEANLTVAELCNFGPPGDSSIWMEFAYNPQVSSLGDRLPLVVQATRLRCGGLVLGISVAHCIEDGNAAVQFINAWSEIARGATKLSIEPYFDRSILRPRIPPRVEHNHLEFSEHKEDPDSCIQQEMRMTTTYFHVPQELVKALKRQVIREDGNFVCTTFEVVSAQVWRARTKAMGLSSSPTTVKFLFAVDVRNRFEPPLPSGYHGNAFVDACAIAKAEDLVEKPLSYAARLIQNAKNSITNNYVRSVVDFLEGRNLPPGSSKRMEVITASSWCRLALYNADFGWGKPLYVGPVDVDDAREVLFLPDCPGTVECGLTAILALPISAISEFSELSKFTRITTMTITTINSA